MGTLGSGRYAPYAQRPHGRFVNHVEGHKPNAKFGSSATFQQLWEADPIALSQYFPDEAQDRSFDASAADMALFSHLAFWTGCNCERMNRLARMSGLVRAKWDEHKSYIRRSFARVIAMMEGRAVYNASGGAAGLPAVGKIHATPFEWVDPVFLPTRKWIYGHYLIRSYVSLVIAPGGVGKTALLIADALSMVTGNDFLGTPVYGRQLKVWLWNLEDPYDELQRRIAACCQHYQILPEHIVDGLFVDSGRDQTLCVAKSDRNGFAVLEPVIDELVSELKAKQIDVLIVDPFVSSHQVPENDNGAIDAVAKAWGKVANEAQCAVVLVHHLRKLGKEAATAEAARGASALVSAARSVRVLNRMQKSDADKAGLETHRGYFSVIDDKNNLAAPVSYGDHWYHIASVRLLNGDNVGVVEPWHWPGQNECVPNEKICEIQAAIFGKEYRKDAQSPDWVGFAIGKIIGLDMTEKTNKQRIKRLVTDWLNQGILKEVEASDKTRRKRPCIDVGKWIELAPPCSGGAEQGGAVI